MRSMPDLYLERSLLARVSLPFVVMPDTRGCSVQMELHFSVYVESDVAVLYVEYRVEVRVVLVSLCKIESEYGFDHG